MKKTTLNKLLQKQGFGTRRECEQMIADGRIKVSGEVVATFVEALEP